MNSNELVIALNQLSMFFGSLNENSSEEDINLGVLISNHFDLLSVRFVNDVVKPRLEKKMSKNIIVDTGAEA